MWEDLQELQKNEYKKMILAFSSLTEVFSQKAKDEDIEKNLLNPIVNSKYIRKRFFNEYFPQILKT